MITAPPTLDYNPERGCFDVVTGVRDTARMRSMTSVRAYRKKDTDEPGRVHWHLPATYQHADQLALTLPDAEETEAYSNEATDLVEAYDFRVRAKTERFGPTYKGLAPLQEVGASWLSTGSGILADDMGSGKTVQACAALQYEGESANDVLVITTKSTLGMWAEHIKEWTDATPYIYHGTKSKQTKALEGFDADEGRRVLITTYGLCRTNSRLAPYGPIAATGEPGALNRDWDITIADECMAEGTKVLTPAGEVPIESLKPMDLVLGVDHRTGEYVWSEVQRVMKRDPKPTIEIHGVRMSEDHPVWTDGGSPHYDVDYANNLPQDLRTLRGTIHNQADQGEVLLQKVCGAGYLDARRGAEDAGGANTLLDPGEAGGGEGPLGGDTRKAGGAGEASQPLVVRVKPVPGPEGAGESTSDISQERVEAPEWGERSGSYRPAIEVARSVTQHLGGGAPSGDGEEGRFGVPDVVQAGPGGPREDGRHRGGRSEPSNSPRQGAGQEEGRVSPSSGVDGLSGLKRRGPDGPLWDIETSTGNFLAEGLLVHNCHLMGVNPGKSARALWQIGKTSRLRWGLTGTPVNDRPEDIWNLMMFVDPTVFGTSRGGYRDRYCIVQRGFFGGTENLGLHPHREEEFHRALAPYFLRRLKEEIIKDLPEAYETQRITLPMAPAQQKAYNAVVRSSIADIGGTLIAATDALAKNLVLRYLSVGVPEVDEETGKVTGMVPKASASNKAQFILETATDRHGDPFIVFAESPKILLMLDEVLRAAGHTTGLITGATSQVARDANVKMFQDGKINVMLINKAGAEGITLHAADLIVFAEESYRALTNQQVRDRINRWGQTRRPQTIVLLSADTIDQVREAALNGKMRLQEEVLRDKASLKRLLTGAV